MYTNWEWIAEDLGILKTATVMPLAIVVYSSSSSRWIALLLGEPENSFDTKEQAIDHIHSLLWIN